MILPLYKLLEDYFYQPSRPSVPVLDYLWFSFAFCCLLMFDVDGVQTDPGGGLFFWLGWVRGLTSSNPLASFPLTCLEKTDKGVQLFHLGCSDGGGSSRNWG